MLESVEVLTVEDEETSKKGLRSLVLPVLGDTFEGNDKANDVEEIPEVRIRRRTFHTV